MRIVKGKDIWILKAMAHKNITKFNTIFSFEIWQQDDRSFITVAMISVWKFYVGIFLTKMPPKRLE